MKIGLVDSGCDLTSISGAYIKVDNNSYKTLKLKKDTLKHGTTLASLIGIENANIVCAQVFDKELITTAQTIAYAIDYLIKEKVDLIHTSLGLSQDREVLKSAIKKAMNFGITIVASAPTLSNYKTFPASYKGVIAVCADARCQESEISYINSSTAMFGASPFSNDEKVRGSSVSAAYLTKELAWLHSSGITSLEEQLSFIKANVKYKKAQVKLSPRGII